MIDFYLLCADMKDKHSVLRRNSVQTVAHIFDFLTHPSEATASAEADWRNGFRCIYGEFPSSLSGNSRLSPRALLDEYGISADDADSALLPLIFAIQTYFSLLMKFITADLLAAGDGRGFSHEEIISGEFARLRGISNYCGGDWYSWPLNELPRGFDRVMDGVDSSLLAYRSGAFCELRTDGCDLIKQLYEAVIPKALRHALGEYYTPEWLAETLLNELLAGRSPEELHGLTVTDPTCGSGTFLCRMITLKRRSGCSPEEILASVSGVDINPLAVLTAKTNYLLSLPELADGKHMVALPVCTADVLSFAHSEYPLPGSLKPADIVIGNPPWVNWEYLPEQYRLGSQHLWADYGLFSAKGRELSFSKEDISVLITCAVIDRLLKNGGSIGFVMRRAAFKAAKNGVGFRKFRVRGTNVKVTRVDDLSGVRVFENATASAALFIAEKGSATVYPVPYYLWCRREGVKRFTYGAYSSLAEVLSQVSVIRQQAIPADADDITSVWATSDAEALGSVKPLLGSNGYRARTGVFTGGANAVYWLKLHGAHGGFISASNVVGRAKRKAEEITAELESDYVFPMLKGRDIGRWKISYDTYLLCPHSAETKIRPVPQVELTRSAPLTMKYLAHFREVLDSRNGFAGWEKALQQQEFHSVLRVGEYTFSPYKVVWKYIARQFVCAVAGSVDDEFLGRKLLLPNEKVMFISTDSEAEAYYLCGVLSSSAVAECVRSYMNPTSISAHVLDKLRLPRFDRGSAVHMRISELCREGHGAEDISPYLEEIDRLVNELYGLCD